MVFADIGLAVLFILLGVILLSNFLNTKSKYYRQVLADLFVAAKIRQIAKDESIDLVEELESFKRFCKKQRIEEMSLDNTIEAELQDKITETKSKK